MKVKRTTYVIYGVRVGKKQKKVLGTNFKYKLARDAAKEAIASGKYSRVDIYRTEKLKTFRHTHVRVNTCTRENGDPNVN